jgi:anti-sigma B factor antagonist
MAAPQGTIRFHQDDQMLLFQVDGWATMSQSLSLRRFAEHALAEGARRVWVDLRRCTYLDSTFLGTLLFLHRAALRLGGREFRLISPSCECAKLLQQMGVTEVFPVFDMEEAAPSSWTVLTKGSDDKQHLQRNVLEAHEELACLPGAAAERFRAVVRCLAKDMEKGSG